MNLKLQLILIYFQININLMNKIILTQIIPISPCPKIFQYRFDGIKWYGNLTIINPPINQPLKLKIVMSLKGKPMTNFLGEIELLSRGQYLQNSPVLYKIKFPFNHEPPKLNQILVNNQIRCYGEPDHGIFVTMIQLEHTRNYKFISDKILENSNEDDYLDIGIKKDINVKKIKPSFIYNDESINIRSASNICGKIDGRLIDSDKQNDYLKRGSWPWLTAIYVNNLTSLSYQCGGTLISNRIVISSAHCFNIYNKKITANEVLIFLGRHNLKNWNEEGSIAAPCNHIFIHPDFDNNLSSYDADIAVIMLKNQVIYSTYIRPICLWSGSTKLEYIEGENGLVVGWGNHNIKSTITTIPTKIYTVIASNMNCLKSNRKFYSLISNRTFCAIATSNNNNNNNDDDDDYDDNDNNYYNDQNNGPCNGDSGVGLMIYQNNRWKLRGIVSASLPTNKFKKNINNFRGQSCFTNEYVIYTDVSKFLDWIYSFVI